MPRDLDHVHYILDSINALESLSAKGHIAFEELSYWSYQGVLRQLHTLAESAHKLSDTIKQQHQHIKWREISDFRNFLVHDYLAEIDRTVIWNVLSEELPCLRRALSIHASSRDETNS